MIPCRNDLAPNLPASCGDATFTPSDPVYGPALEFDVAGPEEGVGNGGMNVSVTSPNNTAALMTGATAVAIQVQRLVEGSWQTMRSNYGSRQLVTINDPEPGRWRVRLNSAIRLPARITVNFDRVEAEEDPARVALGA